jgi:tetratricopeptide (TPR) repeat protein
MSCLQQGQLDQARAHCEEMVRIDPRHWAAWDLLGSIAMDRGDLARAVAPWGNSLQSQPNQPATWTNLGVALRALARPDKFPFNGGSTTSDIPRAGTARASRADHRQPRRVQARRIGVAAAAGRPASSALETGSDSRGDSEVQHATKKPPPRGCDPAHLSYIRLTFGGATEWLRFQFSLTQLSSKSWTLAACHGRPSLFTKAIPGRSLRFSP